MMTEENQTSMKSLGVSKCVDKKVFNYTNFIAQSVDMTVQCAANMIV